MTIEVSPAAGKNRARPPEPDELDPAERMSREQIEQLQLRRLRHTVRYAYDRVPLYRRKFDAAGIHPGDVRELSDLTRLPFTTKEDLRETYPYGMFAVPREQLARLHASSGTTGRATVVGYTKGDLDVWAALVARSLRASGIRPGQLVHNAYGYGLFTGGLGAHAGIERLGASVVPMSGGNTLRQVQLIMDLAPDAVLCTPTYLLTIIDALRDSGVDPRETSLKVAVLGAEPWTDEMRRSIESALDVDALDIYGLSEVMGPGVGNECIETKDGPHIWEDHFLPEVIDADSGTPLPDGEQGELVFTTLTKQALPVIRYRTHDITTLLPGTARPGMRRMRRVAGRNDDMIILRGVNLFPTQIEEIALTVDGLSPHFALVLSTQGRMDCLTVRIEPLPGVGEEHRARAAVLLRSEIKTRIGSSVVVQIVPVGSLDRSTGKLQRLYDHRT